LVEKNVAKERLSVIYTFDNVKEFEISAAQNDEKFYKLQFTIE